MIKKRWAVFLSGTGSNFSTLLEKSSHLDVALVVSNKSNAYGLKKAKKAGIPFVVFEKQDSWDELILLLKKHRIDFIFLMGFLRILPPQFIKSFEGRILNIHPSVLPEYPGLNSIDRAFEDKRNTGATIHFVTEGVDEGPIVLQKRVSLQESLDETKLRVHIQEHRLVRKVLDYV